MIYQELLPGLPLQRYVACYWMVRSEPGDITDFRMIYPDGCTDIIFNFGAPLISKVGSDLHINSFKSFIVGNMTRAVLSSTQSQYNLLGVRFKPGAMQNWIRLPMNEFTDEIANAEAYPVFQFWREQLYEQSATAGRISRLNTLLLQHFSPFPQRSTELALAKLQDAKGICSISQLCREIGISQKQMERNFKQHVGLTPKQFARTIQFNHVSTLLRAKGEDSLLQLAADGGYADHAHFTKSFRAFSGITPSEFLKLG